MPKGMIGWCSRTGWGSLTVTNWDYADFGEGLSLLKNPTRERLWALGSAPELPNGRFWSRIGGHERVSGSFSTGWGVPTASLSSGLLSGLGFGCLSPCFERLHNPFAPQYVRQSLFSRSFRISDAVGPLTRRWVNRPWQAVGCRCYHASWRDVEVKGGSRGQKKTRSWYAA